jgi:hypothetical protein
VNSGSGGDLSEQIVGREVSVGLYRTAEWMFSVVGGLVG